MRTIAGGEGFRLDGRHLLGTELLAPAHVEHYDYDPSLPQWYRRSKAFDDRHVYRLHDVCVSPRTGLCWIPDGLILAESCTGGVARLLGWGGAALEEMLVGERETVEGRVVVLPVSTYSHWLLEDLPAALHSLEREPDATVVVARDAPRYLEGALELLGITRIRRSDEPVRAEELVLTARDPSYEFTPREDLEVLRRRLLPAAGRGSDDALYLSRRLEQRRPANEPELERALSKRGFRIVEPRALPFGEQVRLLAGARFVAGAHGAGLAGVVWSEPVCVSEIFVPPLSRDTFGRLAVSLGAIYQPFDCSPDGTAPVAEIVEAASAERSGVGVEPTQPWVTRPDRL